MAYQSALQQQSTNTLVNNNSSQASVNPNNVSTANSQQPNQATQVSVRYKEIFLHVFQIDENNSIFNFQYKVITSLFQAHPGVATRRIQTPSPPVWREFKIPPLWKRASAEIIDFSILFLLKVVVTFVAVDYFELLDLDR